MALISEKKGWHWLITWDNPMPANSSSMIAALSALGKVQQVYTKTTVVFAPRKTSTWRMVRTAIENNLNPSSRAVGKATYANFKSSGCFECIMTRKRGKRWRRVN